MDYKNVLLNKKAYYQINVAKKSIIERTGSKKVSFSDIINLYFKRHIEFLDINSELKAYIKTIGDILGKNSNVLSVLLFGSVVNGTYKKYSDIDILIVIDNNYKKNEMLDNLPEIRKKLDSYESSLYKKDLPSSVSFMILQKKELEKLNPIYFDFMDFGVILYDYSDTITNFFDNLTKIKYKREYTLLGEVIKWEK